MDTPTKTYAEVEEQHAQMVDHLAKAGSQINDELTSYKKNLWIISSLFAVEVSSFFDKVKKVVAYNKKDSHDSLKASLYDVSLGRDTLESVLADKVEFKQSIILSDQKCHALHMATGIFGEAGEILEAIVNCTAHPDQEVDLTNLDEEIGDLEFYLQGLRAAYGIQRKDTLQNNYAKLMHKRYPNGFSNDAAIARADKEPDNHPELTGMAKIDGEIVETYESSSGSEADCKSAANCS